MGGGTINPGNYDEVSNNYDFSNEVTQSIRIHHNATNGASPATLTIANAYVYDHMGRKRQCWSNINNTGSVLLSQNDYNEVGQELTKHLHSEDSGISFLQNISYSYNERGWLTTENSTKFMLNLAYNNNITTGATPQYNGNIAEMYSTSERTDPNSRFKYTYDPLNRLIAAEHSNNQLTENGISYDKMGNIMALNRAEGANVASLGYSYDGNQLTKVLKNNNAYRTYSYDNNGNARTDGGTKNIIYNILNLPQSVTQNNATLATYTYEAGGNKVRNVSIANNEIWDYDNEIVYYKNTIAFIGTEEGRAIPNGITFSYQYNLKDHLGNDRVSLDKQGYCKRMNIMLSDCATIDTMHRIITVIFTMERKYRLTWLTNMIM